MHGTSQSAPHIAGIIALMQQLSYRENGRYLSVTEVKNLLISTAAPIKDGDDENDNVANTGLTFPRVDVLALGEALLEDTTPPQVSQIASNIETGDSISDNEPINANISQLIVTFNESVQNPAGDDMPNDVTNTTNYLLVADGEDGAFETAVCGTIQGDDDILIINAVTYNNETKTAVVTINNGIYLPEDNYRFFVCKENLQDLAGNYLNGGENDYSLTFSVRKSQQLFLPMILK